MTDFDRMTDLKTTVADLRAKAEAATPGPWESDHDAVIADTREQVCCGKGYHSCCGQPEVIGECVAIAERAKDNDATYIAAASPTSIIEVCKALEDARGEVERRDKVLAWVVNEVSENEDFDADDLVKKINELPLQKAYDDGVRSINAGLVAELVALRARVAEVEAESAETSLCEGNAAAVVEADKRGYKLHPKLSPPTGDEAMTAFDAAAFSRSKPAFPQVNNVDRGMTLREYAAVAAMQGLLANSALWTDITGPSDISKRVKGLASVAEASADALLAKLAEEK